MFSSIARNNLVVSCAFRHPTTRLPVIHVHVHRALDAVDHALAGALPHVVGAQVGAGGVPLRDPAAPAVEDGVGQVDVPPPQSGIDARAVAGGLDRDAVRRGHVRQKPAVRHAADTTGLPLRAPC